MPHAKVLGEIHSEMIKIGFIFETHKSIPAAVEDGPVEAKFS